MSNKLLNVIQQNARTIMVPTSIGEIEIKEFTVKQLKKILALVNIEDQNKVLMGLIYILDESVVTPGVSLRALPSIDIERIYLALNRIQRGDVVKMDLVCGHCEKEFTGDVNLGVVGQSCEPVTEIKLDSGLVFNMRQPTMLESILVGQSTDDYFNIAIRCITSVDTGTEILQVGENKDLSPEELEEVIEYLDSGSLGKLFDFIERIPTVVVHAPIACPYCQAKDVLHLSGIAEIMG
ncbi:hypothetical protein CJP16_09510 [Aeromonas sobria]|uniref:Baseplate protein n=1 Tax=Aeromonas sobria TaxID=646 RepID=A0A2N3J0K8_AERSO|nr:hypothetical protein [Aeromonas sobria]PKQ78980.1 hypothetical protein CJP16_09510 [Aeromonas sobria]